MHDAIAAEGNVLVDSNASDQDADRSAIPKKLLVIDDQVGICKVIAHVAAALGLDTRVIHEPLDVADAFIDFAPDVVLLDIIMPGKDGIDLLNEMLRQRPTMSESTARFAGWFACRAGQHLGFILRLAFVAGRQSSQPTRKQVSVFNTEEKGRTAEHTDKQGFWRFTQECGHAPREGPKLAFSVCSIVLPFSSVLKTLTYLISGLFGAELYHLESNAPASCPGRASKRQLLGVA